MLFTMNGKVVFKKTDLNFQSDQKLWFAFCLTCQSDSIKIVTQSEKFKFDLAAYADEVRYQQLVQIKKQRTLKDPESLICEYLTRMGYSDTLEAMQKKQAYLNTTQRQNALIGQQQVF